MRIAVGSYTGNGTVSSLTLPFRPEGFMIVSGSREICWWSREGWSGRTNSAGVSLSIALAVWVEEKSVSIGNTPGSGLSYNTSGNVYYYLAFANGDAESALETFNYQGNQTAGRVIPFTKQAKPDVLFVKRDTPRDMIIKSISDYSSGASATGITASTTAFITALSVGSFTVDASPQVNENSGNRGEATQVNAFFNTANCKVVTWTGDGAASRTIAGGVGNISAVLAWADQGGIGMRFSTSAMPAGRTYKAISAASTNTGEIGITPAGDPSFTTTSLNTAGTVYVALVWGPDDGAAQATTPRVITTAPASGRKAIYLPGRDVASYIDCGTSDTLMIGTNQPYSIELIHRSLYYNSQGDGAAKDNCGVIVRGAPGVDFSAAGSVSWGVTLAHASDDGNADQGLMGPTYQVVVTDRQALVTSAAPATAGKEWRTGILTQTGRRWEHLLLTHDGNGGWVMYRNGRVVKRRQIDMVGTYAQPNTYAGSGHRTVMGARMGMAGPLFPMRMYLALARLYSGALTQAQVTARYQRSALGTNVADVTAGLLEEWDAQNATGTTLPAGINAANNGTIVNGSIVTL